MQSLSKFQGPNIKFGLSLKIASDLFKSLIDAKWTEYISSENLTLVNKSYVMSDYEESESDIVYKSNINNNEVYFYILLEFQSTVDYRMPLKS